MSSYLVAIIGLIPIPAGVFNFCLPGPLLNVNLWGRPKGAGLKAPPNVRNVAGDPDYQPVRPARVAADGFMILSALSSAAPNDADC